MSKAKQNRESKLLDELQNKHGYMFLELRHKDDRTTMQYERDPKTGKSKVTPAVCIKLIVPTTSKLGIGIIKMRDEKKKEKKKACQK